MPKNKTKAESEPSVLCESCGNKMSPQEIRAYREGLYGIDPHGDRRKWCADCKRGGKQ